MAVRSKEEIIASITAKLGEDKSDDVIQIIEDVNDTLDNLTGASGGKDWKAEAERIDNEWREKYITRFTTGSTEDPTKVDPKLPEKNDYSFDNLFKEGV